MDKRYQIFISSTFSDLEDERKEVMEAILNLGCFPAGMEMFPASDDEQFEYIKTIIDESDYYVLIVAGRYGSLAEDGISYTEKEFDYARKKGIPTLVFIKKDIDNISVNKTDKDSNKTEKLNKFREKVATNRVAKFWDNSSELKYNVHDSLSKAFKTHPRIGWIRGDISNSTELLTQINELRMQNDELKSKIGNHTNEKAIINTDNLSKGESTTEIYADVQAEYTGSCKLNAIKMTWDEIFNIIGGEFLEEKSNDQAFKAIAARIKENKFHGYYYSFTLDKDSYNKIKIQFYALGLLDIRMKEIENVEREFLVLSEEGKRYLISLKAEKCKIE